MRCKGFYREHKTIWSKVQQSFKLMEKLDLYLPLIWNCLSRQKKFWSPSCIKHCWPWTRLQKTCSVQISLGRLVRQTRKYLKLTQPQLALAANVGVRFIVELEVGKSTLRLENILRVIQALGGVLSVEGMDPLIGKLNENSPHNPKSAQTLTSYYWNTECPYEHNHWCPH